MRLNILKRLPGERQHWAAIVLTLLMVTSLPAMSASAIGDTGTSIDAENTESTSGDLIEAGLDSDTSTSLDGGGDDLPSIGTLSENDSDSDKINDAVAVTLDSGYITAQTVRDGVVYDGEIVEESGTEVWSTDLPSSTTEAMEIIEDEVAIIAGSEIHAVALEDDVEFSGGVHDAGDVIWSSDLSSDGDDPFTAVEVLSGDETALVGGGDNDFRKIAIQDGVEYSVTTYSAGEEIWSTFETVFTPSDIVTNSEESIAYLFQDNENGEIFAFAIEDDVEFGDETYDTEDQIFESETHDEPIHSGELVSNDEFIVTVGFNEIRLSAAQPDVEYHASTYNDGDLIWSRDPNLDINDDGAPNSGVITDDEEVLIYGWDGGLEALAIGEDVTYKGDSYSGEDVIFRLDDIETGSFNPQPIQMDNLKLSTDEKFVTSVSFGDDLNIVAIEDDIEYEGDTYQKSDVILSGDVGSGDVALTSAKTIGDVVGTVMDRDGEPIEGATVVGTGLTEDVLDMEYENPEEELEDKQAELEEIREDIEVDRPEDYSSGMDITDGIVPDADDAGAEYVAVHEFSDWNLNPSRSIGDTITLETSVDPDIDDPQIRIPTNEPVVLSLWDPAEQGGFYFGNDPIDSELPGGTTSGEIVVEDISPIGETQDTQTLETSSFVEITSARNVGTKTHEASTYAFSNGFYRVYPEGSPELSYVIVAGDPTSIADRFERDLRDEAGELSERSQQIRDYIEGEGMFIREETTDDDGSFQISIPDNTHTVELEAYKTDGDQLTDIDEPNLQDLRDLQDEGYEGSFYIPTAGTESVEPPDRDVELELRRVNLLPGQELSALNQFLEDQVNSFLDDPMDQISTWGDQVLNELNPDEFEQRWDDRLETFEELVEKDIDDIDWDDIEGVDEDDIFDEDGNLLSPDEIEDEIPEDPEDVLDDIEDEIDSAPEPDDWEPPDFGGGGGGDDGGIFDPSPPGDDDDDDDSGIIDPSPPGNGDDDDDDDGGIIIDDELLNVEYPLPDGIDEEDVILDIHWSDGTTDTVDEEYWTVEDDDGIFDTNRQLVIEDYPVEETDPAAFTIDIRAVSPGDDDDDDDSGGIIDDDIPVQNPAFVGDLPTTNVNLNTLSPGPSEDVRLNLRPEDSSEFDEMESVTVFDPDGNEIEDAEITGHDSATFPTDGAGVHHVRASFSTPGGEEFTQSFKVEAGDTSIAQASTVRAERSAFGTFAIVGEGLEDARISENGDTTSVVATVPANEGSPGEIHIRPQGTLSGSDSILDVSVVRGADEQAVNDNVGIIVHLGSHTDGALHWRNGEPITWAGDTRFGEIQDRGGADSDKHVIRTFTDADGQASIKINEDPDGLDRVSHWWNVWWLGVPILTVSFGELLGGLLGTGLSVVLWHRRRRLIG